MSDDDRTVTLLRAAVDEQASGRQLDPAVIDAARRALDGRVAVGARRRPGRWLTVAAACVLVIAAAVAISALTGARQPRGGAHAGGGDACADAVVRGALPAWARAGFTADAVVQPHVTGANGRILGVLFTDPLRSPPAAGTTDKILWVARDPGRGPLVITARPATSDRGPVVTRTVAGGPGPSTAEMPTAGCWRFTLRWSGQVDTAYVPYAGPAT